MYLVKPPALVKPFMREALWHIDTDKKVLYVTFDDGPQPGVTDKALDILDGYDAKATFFCLGKNIEAQPALYQQVVTRGHKTCNHSWDHPSGWNTDDSAYIDNVAQCAALLESNYFRPPYGRISRTQYKALKPNYTIVMWDVLSGDYDQNTSPEKCAENVMKHATPGSIIVFHDSVKAQRNMLYALPKVLSHFAELGYKFDVLP